MPPVQIEPDDYEEATAETEGMATILKYAMEDLAARLGLPLDAVRIRVTI